MKASPWGDSLRNPQDVVGGGPWRAPVSDSQQDGPSSIHGQSGFVFVYPRLESLQRWSSPTSCLSPHWDPSQSQYCILATGINTPNLGHKMHGLCFSTKSREIFLQCCKVLLVRDPVAVSLPQQHIYFTSSCQKDFCT